MFGKLGWCPEVRFEEGHWCLPLRGRDLHAKVREAHKEAKREGRRGLDPRSKEAGWLLREAGWRQLQQQTSGVSGVSKEGARGSLGV